MNNWGKATSPGTEKPPPKSTPNISRRTDRNSNIIDLAAGSVNQTIRVGPAAYRSSQPQNQMQFNGFDFAKSIPSNAPTSLANLAQLSGLTILPIPELSSSSPRSNMMVNNNSKGHFDVKSQKLNLNLPSSSDHLSTTAKLPVNRSTVSNTNSRARPKQKILNLEKMPSAQLLNINSLDNDTTGWRKGAQIPKLQNIQSNKNNKNNKNNRVKSNQSRLNHASNQPDMIEQKIDSSNQATPDFGYKQDTPNSIRSRGSYHRPTNCLPTGQALTFDGEPPDNLGLLRLFAILNNPALTITPVGGPNIQSLEHGIQGFRDGPKNQSNHKINTDDRGHASTNPPSFIASTEASINKSYLPPSRIAKSTASLQQRKRKHPEDIDLDVSTVKSIESSSFQGDASPEWRPAQGSEFRTNQVKLHINHRDSEEDAGVDESLRDPTVPSSVKNLMMQLPTNKETPTLSMQMLKHIAEQCQDQELHDNFLEHRCYEESRELLNLPRVMVEMPSEPAKIILPVKMVQVETSRKIKRYQLKTDSKHRMFVRRTYKCPKLENLMYQTTPIHVEDIGTKQVYISDQHFILDSLMPDENKAPRKTSVPEPDDIFVNRSKRVMSRIDTMIERKKRRRFERISSREEPKTSSIEEQCAESEAEWSSDDNDDQYPNLINVRLPLNESETPEKREHMATVGLVSRDHKNRLAISGCEQRLKLFSPLILEKTQPDTTKEIQIMVDAMLKTGGGSDIQLRTDTNIKRQDLPLLEGLNRNSSRIKMSYMTVLGLEKRSKRTTLYKARPIDATISNPVQSKRDDLSTLKSPIVTSDHSKQVTPVIDAADLSKFVSNNCVVNNVRAASETVHSNLIPNCRDSVKPENKDDYMKSLGLMAS